MEGDGGIFEASGRVGEAAAEDGVGEEGRGLEVRERLASSGGVRYGRISSAHWTSGDVVVVGPSFCSSSDLGHFETPSKSNI